MFTTKELSDKVNRYIADWHYSRRPEGLYAPIQYVLSLGGKRLRPVLMLMAYNLYRDDVDTILPSAVGLETYHNYTLLHDDLMDRADMRRNKPTVHKVWDDNTAILSGDAMLISAYRLLSEYPPQVLPQILARFNTMAIEVCEGQQYDMDFEARESVSVEEYLHMIELKTSALLSGATVIGAIIGGAGEEDCQRLYRFATELGLAFQLQDDLLDSYGDERLGKAIGGDILEGKKTYLMVLALSKASAAEHRILASTYSDPTLSDQQKIARVREVFDKLGVARLTEQQINHRFERALNTLDTLSVQSEGTARLREYAGSLIGRNK